MPVIDLTQVLDVLEPYGPVEPTTLLGPVRQGLGKYGDGLFIEEGTTNLVTNPGAEVDLTGWSVVAGSATLSRDTTRMRYGVASVKVTVTGTGDVTVRAATSAYSAGNVAGGTDVYPLRTATIDINAGSIVTRTSNIPANQWTRCTTKSTGASAGAYLDTVYNGGVAGDVFWIDAAQAEQKAYPTSFASGDLATAWNAPGNLLPTAAQSFEDGTTGGWTAGGGTAPALTNSATAALVGTLGLLITHGAAAIFQSRADFIATGLTVGKTYTFTPTVRVPAGGSPALLAGVIGLAGGTASTITGAAQRLPFTFIATATSHTLSVLNNGTATAGQTGHVDAVRFEEGTGSAAYRWTGAENASTSTRTAGRLEFAAPTVTTSAITLTALVRVSSEMVAQLASGFPAPIELANGSGSDRLSMYFTGTQVAPLKVVSFTNVGAGLTIGTPAVGDLIFLAVTYDGSTLTIYASKNGGALVSQATGSVTIPAAPTIAIVGANANGNNTIDAVVEQALVYNGALSSSEIAALAFQGEARQSYAEDTRVVFAAATGIVRGTVQAATAAGVGAYRKARSLSAYAKPLNATSSSPDDDSGTTVIAVPAGSGVGAGQVVALNGTRYTVQRVSSPGGVVDELYVA